MQLRKLLVILVAAGLFGAWHFEDGSPPHPDAGSAPKIGVNFVHPHRLSVAEQEAALDAMHREGVRLIRVGVPRDSKDFGFLARAMAHGIQTLLIVRPVYEKNAPFFPWQRDKYPSIWAGHPLSSASPELSRASFDKLLTDLDTAGIRLAGLQLSNEINGASFNREFPVPGEGRHFGRKDLETHPVAKQVAKGFLRYLDVLAELKKARNESRLNYDVPLISAGLVGYEAPEGPLKNSSTDIVSANATLDFLRANGLDDLVDAYGIHVYPWADRPGDPRAAAGRRARLARYVLSRCGINGGKPCWLTEWGFADERRTCPPDDSARSLLIEEMRQHLSYFTSKNRLTGIFYYAWDEPEWKWTLFRCGALPNSGKSAIRPY